ncbi:hypothetical protein J1614_000933 [Plenodomus biglobosus]|nr:hypothetical protein J1614_000933 [Plenodomus biglobosus]
MHAWRLFLTPGNNAYAKNHSSALHDFQNPREQGGWDDENGDEEGSEDVAVDGLGGESSISSTEDRPRDDEMIENVVGTEVVGGEGDSSEGEREGDETADERGDAGVGVARARNSVKMIRRESNGWRRRGVKW